MVHRALFLVVLTHHHDVEKFSCNRLKWLLCLKHDFNRRRPPVKVGQNVIINWPSNFHMESGAKQHLKELSDGRLSFLVITGLLANCVLPAATIVFLDTQCLGGWIAFPCDSLQTTKFWPTRNPPKSVLVILVTVTHKVQEKRPKTTKCRQSSHKRRKTWKCWSLGWSQTSKDQLDALNAVHGDVGGAKVRRLNQGDGRVFIRSWCWDPNFRDRHLRKITKYFCLQKKNKLVSCVYPEKQER